MRELYIAPGVPVQVAVDEYPGVGKRVLLRIGNGRYRPMSARKARDLAALLNQAADEVAPPTLIARTLNEGPEYATLDQMIAANLNANREAAELDEVTGRD